MKKHIILSMLLLCAGMVNAQIFDAHKRALNKVEKRNGEALKGGADFVLDPIEQAPTKSTKRNAIAGQTSWGCLLYTSDAADDTR